MNEQIPFALSTSVRLLYGGQPLGRLVPVTDGRPIFEVVEWDAAALERLAEDIGCHLSSAKARANKIAEIAADEFGVTVRDVFAKRRFREATDARAVAAALLHAFFPTMRDRVIADAFGRERTWALHVYSNVAGLCETSAPFRDKFERVKARASAHLWPAQSTEPATVKAP